ncbi:MAG: carboxypeptidase-like regulatory domain-containing protein [Flavobacteriales bacterium]|jgi:hypothetical protein|nr:carboxypeptidase-like regulatory domain-containing protein [Flavobacteriales bacterium]
MQKNIIILLLFIGNFLNAQVTSGKLEGYIKSGVSKEALPGVNILLFDTETGKKYGTSSRSDGYYSFNHVATSKNYQLEISFIGYQTEKRQNIAILLGQTTKLNFLLNEENNALEEIVLSDESEKATNNQADFLINQEKKDKIPTINRGIQDLTNTMSSANLNSFAGASNRFNNLNIDGMVNNDVIGFQEPASGASGSTATGSPGALAQTQPIGFGAIKELSVKLSPFDVSVGNFTGANINLITKNGTNRWSGNAYLFGHNQNLLGNYSNGVMQEKGDFYDAQYGLSFGGPIKKDKAFVFFNVEQTKRKENVMNAPGSSGSRISLASVKKIANHLKDQYNYDPGTFENADLKRESTKVFGRLDYNISPKHTLVFRNNLIFSESDQLEWNANFFNFGNQGFQHQSVANSSIVELSSFFDENTHNKFSIGYNYVNEDRDYQGRVFPHIQIDEGAANTIFAGSYREASVFGNTQNTWQLQEKIEFSKDKHTFSGGFGGEFSKIEYRFLSAWNGRWEYGSVNDFLNDRPSRIRGVYNSLNNDYEHNRMKPSAAFGILMWNAFLQDEYRYHDRLKFQFGLRMDGVLLDEKLPVSQEIKNTPEFAHFENTLSTKPRINPRFSFEYQSKNERPITLSGGTGFYSGRIPNLWFAYAEYISGTEYFNVDIRPQNSIKLTEDLSDLANQQSGLTEINLINNDFKLPREWKSQLGIQVPLAENWRFSFEGMYHKVIDGIYFQSINRKNVQKNYDGADNRAYFSLPKEEQKINKNFTNVFLLKNTNKGYRYQLSANIQTKIKNYEASLGYTYGVSKDLSSTVRNSHAANFEWNQTIQGNEPQLSYSNFDLRHKFVSFHTYSIPFKKGNLNLGLFYTLRSGSPYSFIYSGDVNKDGSSKNDLIYIPQNSTEIQFQEYTNEQGALITKEQQWKDLDEYINSIDYLTENRGTYAKRNGARTPWNQEINLSLSYDFSVWKTKRLKLSADIFNVANLLNKNWGKLVYVPNVVNSSYRLLDFKGIEDNKPVYQFKKPNGKPWIIDNFNSRWRVQLGVSLEF